MKSTLAGLLAVCVAYGAFSEWRYQRAIKEAPAGEKLDALVDRLVSDWPTGDARRLNFVVTTVDSAIRPFDLSSVGGTDVPQYVNRQLKKLDPRNPTPNQLWVPPFLGEGSHTVYRAFFDLSPEAQTPMINELQNAILNADAHGVRVNILAQGPAAVPALKAVIAAGESKPMRPMVDNFIGLGTNSEMVTAADPEKFLEFTLPPVLTRWINIWSVDDGGPALVRLEVHIPEQRQPRLYQGPRPGPDLDRISAGLRSLLEPGPPPFGEYLSGSR